MTTAVRPRRHLRVVVAADAVLLREGLVRLIVEDGCDVVASVGEGPALETAVRTHRPDVAVVDVRLPSTRGDDGLRAAITVRRAQPRTPVLVLSHHVEASGAAELLADGSGAVGYVGLDRFARVAEFLDALHTVASGGTVIDPEVVSQLLRRRDDPLARLTPRERELLAFMAEGRSNADIARQLVVSASAVEKHVGNVFAKLGLLPDGARHRRVLAVLAHLDAQAQNVPA